MRSALLRSALLLVLVALLGAGCTGDDGDGAGDPQPPAPSRS